jgi:hypothetical protein
MLSNAMLGGGGWGGFGGEGGFGSPLSGLYQQPSQNIFAGGMNVPQGPGAPGGYAAGQAAAPSGWPGFAGAQASPEIGKKAQQSMPTMEGPAVIGQPFPNQFTAGTSPLEFAALAHREGLADQLQGIGNPLLNLGSFTAQGGFLTPESNPFLGANIEAAMRPITQEFTQSVLPQFGSQAIQSGAFGGSSARDLAFNQLASGYGQQVLDVGTQIAFDNYMRERQFQQQAGQLLDQGAMLNQLTPELLAQTGLGYRELAQRPLDEALLQYQESLQAPFRPINAIASIIHGGNVGAAFPNIPQPSALSGGILGALGGASAGVNIYGQGGGEGNEGLAALLGGGLGGIGGVLG